MELLYTYSLAHPQHTSGSFYIHPVVHRSERVEKAQETVNLISSVIDRPGAKLMEDLRYERTILPHIDCITKHAQEYLTMAGGILLVLCSYVTLSSVNCAWGRTNEAHRITSDIPQVTLLAFGR